MSLGKARNDIVSTFEWLDWQEQMAVDSKTEKVTFLLVEVP